MIKKATRLHVLGAGLLTISMLLAGCQGKSEANKPGAENAAASAAGAPAFSGTIKNSIRDSKPDFRMDHAAPEKAPNIVVIVIDDLGFSDVGAYGSEIRTPNIDRLAQNGLRYNNFTVTAMCSPTRAALLTGLNHHSAGVGWVAEWDFGYPGYRGELQSNVVTLPQILQQHGYATLAAGKWHLTNGEHRSRRGPFDSWPTQKGFDRYWGFLDGEADQFEPATLISGNEIVEVPKDPNYYFPDDLTRHAEQMVRDLRAVDQNKPFFLYYTPGAVHAPHQTKEVDRKRYEGKYVAGWDKIREQRLARQKELGIAPANTDLAPRNPHVEAWDSLTDDQKKMYARFQENFAGFVDNVDQQVGELLTFLEKSGELDNTIVMFMSDNGASPEGDVEGQANGLAFFHYHKTTTAENLKHFDDLGARNTHPHYPIGWAQAGNTPFKHTKRTTHGGGIRAPFIISWPKGIAARGEIRNQYQHVNDITPTLLDLLKIDHPDSYRGTPVKPMEGVSFAQTLNDAKAPSKKTEQYYELEANRGYYDNGWKMVTYREGSQRFDEVPMELYNLNEDFSESHNLADKYPEKVAELDKKWWAAANKYQVLPLVDLGLLERPQYSKFVVLPPQKHVEILRDAATVPQYLAPVLPGTSYTLTADVQRTGTDQDGVLVAQGDQFSGYALYIRNNRLVWERNTGADVIRIETPDALPAGAAKLQFKFEKVSTGAAVVKGLLGQGLNFDRLQVLKGKGSLWVNGKKVAEAAIDQPFFVAWEGLDVGRDTGSPVSAQYADKAPFEFQGGLEKVVYDLQ
jgi:arylsulfatase